jgi:hypothetical protein
LPQPAAVAILIHVSSVPRGQFPPSQCSPLSYI